MFERILIRRMNPTATGNFVDVGFLCEAMLFYREVVLIADQAIARQMITDVGGDTFAALLENDFLRFHYTAEQHAIQSIADAEFSAVTVKSPSHYPATFFPKLLEDSLGRRTKAERVAKRILRHTKRLVHRNTLDDDFRAAIRNQAVIDRMVFALLHRYLRTPERLPTYSFVPHSNGRGAIQIETDIPWDKVNEEFHRFVSPSHSTLNTSLLLAQLLNWQVDLRFAAEHRAELATDPIYREVDQLELRAAIDSFRRSRGELDAFRDFTIDGRGIASAINSGARRVEEILPLLEKSRRFKQWIGALDGDTSLIKEYHRQVTEDSWVDKLPTKTVRFALFTCAGLALDAATTGGIATAAGVALGAVDTFYLDNLIKGWKPNQFVNGPYETFVRRNN